MHRMPAPPPPAVQLIWHGGPSVTLDLGGLEVLIDPAFSRPGDYPPWFTEACANPGAPSVDDYLAACRPDYLFITHGHFDHFDLRTVERLAAALDFTIVGSPEVLRVCREVLGLPEERLMECPVAGSDEDRGAVRDGRDPETGWLALEPRRVPPGAEPGTRTVAVRAVPGPHWLTGDEAETVARKFATRPDRYGALPCGGPMLGFVFTLGGLRLYVSGDTEARGLPAGPFAAAVVCCGGELINPKTKEREGPFLDEAALAGAACERLRPQVLVPVHYDHPVFVTPFDPERLREELARYPNPPDLLVPPYNVWTTLVT